MIDSLISPALGGNKSLKSKLEGVRLQIVALRAVEAQIEAWLLEEQQAKDAAERKKAVKLGGYHIQLIANMISLEGMNRASPQSQEWAGLAVIKAMRDGEDAPTVQYAKHAIEHLLKIGAIKRAAVMDPKRGREVPIYEVGDIPSVLRRVGI